MGGGLGVQTPLIGTGLLGIPILGSIPYRPSPSIIGMPMGGLMQQTPDTGVMIGPSTGTIGSLPGMMNTGMNPGGMTGQMVPENMETIAGMGTGIIGVNQQGVVSCPSLMPPVNGMRAGQCERAVFGGSCLVSCMPGFVLTGYPILTCTGLQFLMTYPQIMTGTSQAPYMTSKVTKTTMDFYT